MKQTSELNLERMHGNNACKQTNEQTIFNIDKQMVANSFVYILSFRLPIGQINKL